MFPYHLYKELVYKAGDRNAIPLCFALGTENACQSAQADGFTYTSLFDAQYDSAYYALERYVRESIP